MQYVDPSVLDADVDVNDVCWHWQQMVTTRSIRVVANQKVGEVRGLYLKRLAYCI